MSYFSNELLNENGLNMETINYINLVGFIYMVCF